MKMPTPDSGILARRDEIITALSGLLAAESVISDADERRVYECDGLSAYRQLPMVVVLPSTTAEVSAVLTYCFAEGIKVVPRGAGTSLSGGALPLADGVMLGLGKLNCILDVDFDNRAVVSQPGVTNLAITEAVAHKGFYYAPDPQARSPVPSAATLRKMRAAFTA